MASSIGSLHALTAVLSPLPVEFPAPIVVVRHLHSRGPDLTAGLLRRRVALSVKDAEDGEVARPGAVYLAPPDWHVTVERGGMLRLSRTPKVQWARPAADPLFRSLASVYERPALVVVLTGTGADGAAGARSIKAAGGVVLAQSPATCAAPGMPAAAIAAGAVDFVLPLHTIPAALISLAMVPGAALLFARYERAAS